MSEQTLVILVYILFCSIFGLTKTMIDFWEFEAC